MGTWRVKPVTRGLILLLVGKPIKGLSVKPPAANLVMITAALMLQDEVGSEPAPSCSSCGPSSMVSATLNPVHQHSKK